MNLFNDKYDCGSCHGGNFYSGIYGFVNIGWNGNYVYKGRFNVTQETDDTGTFRIPDLINVFLTAPYMRSGRFETLDQVLEQYSPNIANHNNLDSRLKTASGNAAQMNILRQEKEALITFLGAFTDVSMIGDPMDSNRFRY